MYAHLRHYQLSPIAVILGCAQRPLPGRLFSVDKIGFEISLLLRLDLGELLLQSVKLCLSLSDLLSELTSPICDAIHPLGVLMNITSIVGAGHGYAVSEK